MESKQVHVELGESGLPIRIFRTKAWLDCSHTTLMDRALAVRLIRNQVFDRSLIVDSPMEEHYECERCGRTIAWDSFEMNERVPKGKLGEVSLENCEALCHACHTGDADSAHGNRRWQSAKIKSKT